MLNRVNAKLAGVRQHVSCLALRRIRGLGQASTEEKTKLKMALSESLKALGAAFQFDCIMLAFKYRDATPVALLLYEQELRARKDVPACSVQGDPTWFNHRRVCARSLGKAFVEKAFLGRVASSTGLRLWMASRKSHETWDSCEHFIRLGKVAAMSNFWKTC